MNAKEARALTNNALNNPEALAHVEYKEIIKLIADHATQGDSSISIDSPSAIKLIMEKLIADEFHVERGGRYNEDILFIAW
jgi:hypothetical protein